MNAREAVCAAIIKKGRILLVKKQKTWILPGGKPEAGESDSHCLLREVKEELPMLNLQDLKYFGVFVGTTPHKDDVLAAKVYLTTDTNGDIIPGAEINAAKWVEKPEEYNLSDITRKIIIALREEGYI